MRKKNRQKRRPTTDHQDSWDGEVLPLKEIFLVIKPFVGIAHAGEKVFKRDTKEERATKINDLFSPSQGVNRHIDRDTINRKVRCGSGVRTVNHIHVRCRVG